MSFEVNELPLFQNDIVQRFVWYHEKADLELAIRFREAVKATIRELAIHPEKGPAILFKHPKLAGIRFYRVNPPFDLTLIFYRVTTTSVECFRLLHGSQNLRRRLLEESISEF